MHDEKQNKERKKIMKVTLMPGIESISGSFKQKNGTRVVFTTRKAATTNKEDRTRMYLRSEESYQRKTKVTQKEVTIRNRFRDISKAIRALSEEERKVYCHEWEKAEYKFNGKKYSTLHGYIMARMYAEEKLKKCTRSKSVKSPK
jgi:uncharacterized protein (DUF2344 family)